MTSKNPYRKGAKHSRQKTIKIIEYFCADLSATTTSKLLGMRRSTINERYNYFRNVIYQQVEKEKKEVWTGIFELDESYFGPRRVRGKRGRGAGMKTIIFGLLKRDGKVYTEIVPNCKAKTLKKIISGKIKLNSEINTDGRRGYNGLVNMGYGKHFRVHHSKNEFVRGKSHVNGIESFRSYTKKRMNKFNGILKEKFPLHLKESEFRFNCRIQNKNMYNELRKILKIYVKK